MVSVGICRSSQATPRLVSATAGDRVKRCSSVPATGAQNMSVVAVGCQDNVVEVEVEISKRPLGAGVLTLNGGYAKGSPPNCGDRVFVTTAPFRVLSAPDLTQPAPPLPSPIRARSVTSRGSSVSPPKETSGQAPIAFKWSDGPVMHDPPNGAAQQSQAPPYSARSQPESEPSPVEMCSVLGSPGSERANKVLKDLEDCKARMDRVIAGVRERSNPVSRSGTPQATPRRHASPSSYHRDRNSPSGGPRSVIRRSSSSGRPLLGAVPPTSPSGVHDPSDSPSGAPRSVIRRSSSSGRPLGAVPPTSPSGGHDPSGVRRPPRQPATPQQPQQSAMIPSSRCSSATPRLTSCASAAAIQVSTPPLSAPQRQASPIKRSSPVMREVSTPRPSYSAISRETSTSRAASSSTARSRHDVGQLPWLESLLRAQPKALSPRHVSPHKMSARFDAAAKEQLEVGPEEISWGESLGAGSFGAVFKGTFRGNQIAIKKCKITSRAEARAFLKEIGYLAELRHQRLVSFLGFCDESPHVYMLMELLPRGSLHAALFDKTKQLPSFSFCQKMRMAWQVAEGIKYLHSVNVVHRDLKTQNIVMDDNYDCKICDFGLTITLERSHLTVAALQGSPRYMAPEQFEAKAKITEKVDIWQMGCVMLELMCKSVPFDKCSNLQQVATELLVRKRGPSIPFNTDPLVRCFLNACLRITAEARPAAAALEQGLRGVLQRVESEAPSGTSCRNHP